MKSLIILKSELLQFFTNLSGYIFIAVFVLIYAWFFSMPLFAKNTASLGSFFEAVQYLFIVYIPIITMNLIAKEKQAGTIETLFTLPLKTRDFILGKFLTGFVIVLISLVPSIVHFITILTIGSNVDFGILLCGYLSLILTAAVYCALGIFMGVLSPNQIVSFILSFLVIIIIFLMDNIIIYMPLSLTSALQYISITWQNANLIKGVIDTRVLIYFASLILLFLWAAIGRLRTPHSEHRTPHSAHINILLTIAIIIALNICSLYIYHRFDCTKTKAYSLSTASKAVVDKLTAPIKIKLFFSRDLPANGNDIRRYTADLLTEYQTHTAGNVSFEFINPDNADHFAAEAKRVDVAPVTIEVYEKDRVEFRDIYMGAAVIYGQKFETIPFISDTGGIEFLFTNTIKKISEPRERHIAYFQQVHPWEYHIADELSDEIIIQMPENARMLSNIVSDMAVIDRTDLFFPLPPTTDLLIVNFLPPMSNQTEVAFWDSLHPRQLYLLDQFMMTGKPVIIFTERYNADLNSSPATLFDNNLIETLRYNGIFVKPALVLDAQCFMVSRTRIQNGVPVPVDFHYPFFPAVRSFSDTLAIHTNLHWVQTFYSSEVLNLNPHLSATPLLWTSPSSHEIAGWEVDTDYEKYQNINPSIYNAPPKPLMQIFEGYIRSIYYEQDEGTIGDIPITTSIIRDTPNAKIVVAGTTSLLDNSLLANAPSNADLILNLIDYLTDHTEFIYMRSRNITHSPLKTLSYTQKSTIKYTNLFMPFLMIVAFAGLFRVYFVKHKKVINTSMQNATPSPQGRGVRWVQTYTL